MFEGTPMVFTIMRDSLQRLLADSIPSESIVLGKTLVHVSECNDNENGAVKCTFEDGTTKDFDLLIGADGIRSKVKQEVLRHSRKAEYSNIRIQFGVAKGWNRGNDGEIHQWFGDGTYALTAQYRGLNSEPFEMIALVFRDENDNENSNWDTGEVKKMCVDRLKQTNNPQEVVDLAQRCDRFFDVGVYYYPSLQPWTSESGNVVLIGDAAHAMPPFLGQGANQAIQDAYSLASKLADLKKGRFSTVKNALDAYEKQRKIPTTLIQLESRLLGILETAGDSSVSKDTGIVLPGFVRDAFFYATGKLGVAEQVFLKGATPKV
mmetsp:Transcript_14687/g.24562  ORF Transcript_14687/g.24562 Transcript_14687/m.24562 type:complete len:320 (-) Transcript_14687:126-1085(-)